MKKILKMLIGFITLALVVCVLICIVYRYKADKEEKERAELKLMGYTEYDLSCFHLVRLLSCFDICPPEFRRKDFLEKYEYSWEKRDLKLEAGAHTEECIEAFNYLVFYDSKGINLKTVAEEYGFSEDNQFTLEWIITHPKEICEIVAIDSYMVNDAVRDILR